MPGTPKADKKHRWWREVEYALASNVNCATGEVLGLLFGLQGVMMSLESGMIFTTPALDCPGEKHDLLKVLCAELDQLWLQSYDLVLPEIRARIENLQQLCNSRLEFYEYEWQE